MHGFWKYIHQLNIAPINSVKRKKVYKHCCQVTSFYKYRYLSFRKNLNALFDNLFLSVLTVTMNRIKHIKVSLH